MSSLFVLASIFVIVFLMKCIYDNINAQEEKSKEPPPPTLEDILKSLLGYFKSHLHEIHIYPDSMVLYCFKNSPTDSITDYNEIKIRFCDIGFKSIPHDDCKPLEDRLKSSIGLNSVPKDS